MHMSLNRRTIATACFMSVILLPIPAMADDTALACASSYELTSEYSDRVGDMKFVNESSGYVDVRRVDPDGTSMEMLSVEAGITTSLTQNRNAVYVGLDSDGKCMGAFKLRESRGSMTFTD